MKVSRNPVRLFMAGRSFTSEKHSTKPIPAVTRRSQDSTSAPHSQFPHHLVACFEENGGLRTAPIPCGVLVLITSPGSNVIPWEMNSINLFTEKIIFSLFESCGA
jgi:hypothetical protein